MTKRKDIADALAARLATITGQGTITVERVLRDTEDPKAAARPWFGVTLGVRDSFDYASSDDAFVTSEFLVWGYVHGGDLQTGTRDLADIAVNNLLDAATVALLTDQTLGGLTSSLLIDDARTNEGENYEGGRWTGALEIRGRLTWDRKTNVSA